WHNHRRHNSLAVILSVPSCSSSSGDDGRQHRRERRLIERAIVSVIGHCITKLFNCSHRLVRLSRWIKRYIETPVAEEDRDKRDFRDNKEPNGASFFPSLRITIIILKHP